MGRPAGLGTAPGDALCLQTRAFGGRCKHPGSAGILRREHDIAPQQAAKIIAEKKYSSITDVTLATKLFKDYDYNSQFHYLQVTDPNGINLWFAIA